VEGVEVMECRRFVLDQVVVLVVEQVTIYMPPVERVEEQQDKEVQVVVTAPLLGPVVGPVVGPVAQEPPQPITHSIMVATAELVSQIVFPGQPFFTPGVAVEVKIVSAEMAEVELAEFQVLPIQVGVAVAGTRQVELVATAAPGSSLLGIS